MKSEIYYGFEEKRIQGEEGETKMDNFFRDWYHIEKIPVFNQLNDKKYDRLFIEKDNPKNQYKVEYKNDILALKTKNFFIETESYRGLQNGWIYKTGSDWMSVLVGNKIYLVQTLNLKLFFEKSKNNYQHKETKKTVTNRSSYCSAGYLMPLIDLEKISSIYFVD